MLKRMALLAVLALSICPAAHAQMKLFNIPTPAEPRAIPLYAGVAPGSEKDKQQLVWSQNEQERWVRNVTKPMLIPILPPVDIANGAAVLVLPGGGFQFISIDNEGYRIAPMLNAKGVAVFILQYRTMPTPADAKAMVAYMDKVNAPNPPPDEVIVVENGLPFAIADAQAALRHIRANAAKYGVDPKRVGMLGFSAGAMTTFGLIMANDGGPMPDFAGIIYGPTSMEVAVGPGAKVPADAPPLFNALSADDVFFGRDNFSVIEAWRKAGKSIEFHLYEGGGHGYASYPSGHTSDQWFNDFATWMNAKRFLERTKSSGH